jgi:hypothetical protein
MLVCASKLLIVPGQKTPKPTYADVSKKRRLVDIWLIRVVHVLHGC